MEHRKFLEHRGKRRIEFLEILEGKDLARNLAEDGGDPMFLVEEIGAETGNVRDFVAEIDVAGFFELLYFVFWRDFIEHLFEIIVFQRRMVDALELAIDAEHRIIARSQVKVRSLLLEHQVEKCVDFGHKLCSSG